MLAVDVQPVGNRSFFRGVGSPEDFHNIAQTGRFEESPTRGNHDPDWQGLYLYENGADSLGYVRRGDTPSTMTYGGLFAATPPSNSHVVTVYDPGNPHGEVDPNAVLQTVRNHFDPDGTRIGTEPGAVMNYLAQNNYMLRINDGAGANEIVVPWGDQVRNTAAAVYPGGDFTTYGNRRNLAEEAIGDLNRQLADQIPAPPLAGTSSSTDQWVDAPVVPGPNGPVNAIPWGENSGTTYRLTGNEIDAQTAQPSTGGNGEAPSPAWQPGVEDPSSGPSHLTAGLAALTLMYGSSSGAGGSGSGGHNELRKREAPFEGADASAASEDDAVVSVSTDQAQVQAGSPPPAFPSERVSDPVAGPEEVAAPEQVAEQVAEPEPAGDSVEQPASEPVQEVYESVQEPVELAEEPVSEPAGEVQDTDDGSGGYGDAAGADAAGPDS